MPNSRESSKNPSAISSIFNFSFAMAMAAN
jgi:hypothetical protein